MADTLRNLEIDQDLFKSLLERMIGCADRLQNYGAADTTHPAPQEHLIADIVFEALSPFLKENGGVLEATKYEYVEGRPNVCITYRGTNPNKKVSLVGAHMDVVPADPAQWQRNPFKLIMEDGKCYGRGTTDCLGHVALITALMAKIAETKPAIESTIHVIFIASEELPWPGVGIDEMMKRGHCEHVKGGPVLWVDSADSEPCCGTAGSTQWFLKATGKLFHSGFPNTTVNACELTLDAMHYMQDRFYEDFPPTEKEALYKFTAPSSFKPTTAQPGDNSINQIPGTFTICGDVRLSPSYKLKDVKEKLQQYIDEFMSKKDKYGRGPSKYNVEGIEAKVEIKINEGLPGVYCDMNSPGYKALEDACKAVRGVAKPYSVSGSLPLVSDLKDAGMDLQITGFGLMSTYHANNEYAVYEDLVNGARILAHFIANYETS